jgi:CRP-like cAMP-binding protein
MARLLDDFHVPAGAELLHNRQHECIYLLKTGAVRLYLGEQRQHVTLALLGPGRLFGLSKTFGNASLAIGATTLEPSYICSVTASRLLQLFARHPLVMLKMTQALIEQLFSVESWAERAARPPRVRLANLLLDLCDEFCEPVEGGLRVRFRLTQADLANMINVARETVSRLMAEFERAGWVTREDGLLLIRDRDALVDVTHVSAPT